MEVSMFGVFRRLVVLTVVALLAPGIARAQNESVIIEAESGAAGSQFSVLTDAATGVQYATILGTVAGLNPTTSERVITFSVTFPRAGVYELYARLRVGPATFNDDSFYYANGFGVKSPTSDADWILANGLANPVGYTLPGDKVVGGGPATSGVFKWVKLSAFDGGEPPLAGFTVTEGSLTQTFQVAGREDGLSLDKFAFGPQGVFFTVFELDNGLPGSTVPPPPPFTPTGPPIATNQPKFLGGVYSPTQVVNFTAYWNQVTPENAGKWGSVEGTRDAMNWTELDAAYALAKNNGFPFRMHTLIWGNQQPVWIENLSIDEQRQEIDEWFEAVAARYPDIDFIDVVNEPLHDPPAGPGNGNYIAALGGSGATGWDWVIESFRLARQHFPNAQLGINEFSVTNNTTDMQRYIGIIQLLQAEGLVDTVGVQGHAFSTRVPETTTAANLELLAATGLPIYVTELDIDGPTDEIQLADYQRIFPTFWEHPAVRGITLWGYRPGHWRTAQGAYIAHQNGAERPALLWLKDYVANTTLRPWITLQPASMTLTVGDTGSLSCAGNGSAPLAYQWRRNGVPLSANPTSMMPTLVLTAVVTADAGVYDCVVSNSAGFAVSAGAVLTVNKAPGTISLSNLTQYYDGTPRPVSVSTTPAGLMVIVTYDGSPTPPTAPGVYTVTATIDDPNYFGTSNATLVVTTGVLVRHAPAINGALAGSIQVLLPESTTLNSGASVSGDLLVPGTPTVQLNGQAEYQGTLDGSGNVSPTNFTITLNGRSRLRHVVRRTDAVAFPSVEVPLPPAGTRDVVLNSPAQTIGDFATLRNLTLNAGAGQVAVPPGTYGHFMANGPSSLVLGVEGAVEPSIYNLQSLTLNSSSRVDIVGPVILTVGGNVMVNGMLGNQSNAEWLRIRIATGGLTINSRGAVYGLAIAPVGAVIVNGTLTGGVIADRLTINGGGVVLSR
jgi:endo-1,4-beta-xylanase